MSAAVPLDPAQQRRIGLTLAGAIIGAWIALHLFGVFVFRPIGAQWLWALPLVALQTWLCVGLFIVAHDAMHGSLAPGRPSMGRATGRLALLLYAGFWMDRLTPKHFDHHRHVGTAGDPDFHVDAPTRFGPWFAAFMRRYLGLREVVVMTAVSWTYLLLLHVPLGNLLAFWAVPALLSSLQLFVFGTYLPHRHEAAGFADRHNARSNDYGVLLSLLTCFHFGYHHEHHLYPTVPWWRLPDLRGK